MGKRKRSNSKTDFSQSKEWKSRWCVMRKLSPVADCLHLQLYRDSRDRYKQGLTKASLSLQHFLGLETGFTLDKESNTVAIICQGLIVVLAFDTRERLIQWQVKIHNQLGEGQHFLIQISSSPLKAKLSPGPAKLHIQERRFCLTAGVPPKLAGCWEMKHLRRYGVVDGKFCFEGGSLCGRGEGLYVFLTDQGDEITRSVQLASEGKLNSLRRPLLRNMSVQHESPSRKGLMLRTETRLSEISYVDGCLQTQGAIRPIDNAQPWPSMETQTGVYGHGDTSSLADFSIDTLGAKTCNWPENQLGRCVSCVGKLGLISRPSTAANTPGSFNFNPWVIDESKICLTGIHHDNFRNETEYGCDSSCISVSQKSKYSNSSSSGNECSEQPSCHYSSLIENTQKNFQMPISPPKNFHSFTRVDEEKSRPCRPPKPLKYRHLAESTNLTPKKRINKPPMPLPLEADECSCKSVNYQKEFLHHFDNYNLPKLEKSLISQKIDELDTSQYYDTPHSVTVPVTETVSFANYDIPPAAVPLKNKSTCISNMKIITERQENNSVQVCFGHQLLHYRRRAWMQLPPTQYLPCMNHWPISEPRKPIDHLRMGLTKQAPVYAQVDLSKKTKNRQPKETINDDAETAEQQNVYNYTNVRFVGEDENYKHLTKLNYMNLEFSNSLIYYENVGELLNKAQQKERIDRLNIDLPPAKTSCDLKQRIRVCHKCGHSNEIGRTATGVSNPTTAITTTTVICDNNSAPAIARCEEAKRKRMIGSVTDESSSSSAENTFENYVPMSPIKVAHKLSPEKSASHPILSEITMLAAGVGEQRKTLVGPAASFNYSTLDSFSRHTARPDRPRRSSSTTSSKQTVDELESKNESSCMSDSRGAPTVDSDSGLESDKPSQENDDTLESLRRRKDGSGCIILAGGIRRLSGVAGKSSNRDSSSSNDSGFSSASVKYACQDFNEFEMPLTTAGSAKRHNSFNQHIRKNGVTDDDRCSPMRRRAKSSDPLRDLPFHFHKINIPPKSSSAEAELPLYLTKRDLCKDCISPVETTTAAPYVDCRSTSSGTSDMSDYIETLSISSHSSTDVHSTDAVRMHQPVVSTLKPRSSIEYQKVDRASLLEVDSKVDLFITN